jgi:hypothetical protein
MPVKPIELVALCQQLQQLQQTVSLLLNSVSCSSLLQCL